MYSQFLFSSLESSNQLQPKFVLCKGFQDRSNEDPNRFKRDVSMLNSILLLSNMYGTTYFQK